MAPLVFAALIVTGALAITWGTVAVALRQSPQEELAMDEAGPNPAGRSRLLTFAFGDRRAPCRRSGNPAAG